MVIKEAFLGLGSNMGDRQKYLSEAIRLLDENQLIDVKKISSIYETEPFGGVEQDKFLNMVIKIETKLRPEKLLEAAQEVEKKLKRVRTIRWGPRTVDVDILLYGDEIINTKELCIPHMGITQRAFVLIPLLEIAPDIKLPSGEFLKSYLDKLKDDVKGVKLYEKNIN